MAGNDRTDEDRIVRVDEIDLPDDWVAAEGEPLETERLALEEDERLPWLESGDEDYEEDGSDTGRMMGFVLMGLVALAAIVGGIWWATHRNPDPQLADGSTIQAPAEPYKTAPSEAGGKQFAGTGDSSFAVSEGQTRPAQLATGAAAPKAAASAGTGAAAGAAAPAGGVGVQVAAYSSSASAEAGWAKLSAQHAAILAGVRHRVVEGTADIGKVYRLQAVAGDAAAANALCGRLKAAGTPCQVK
jgi:SPOR domain